MGSNLTARRVNPTGGLSLSTELKLALRKRFDEPIDEILNEGSISYLEGLVDAGIGDAEKLITYIQMHGGVSVKEEF